MWIYTWLFHLSVHIYAIESSALSSSSSTTSTVDASYLLLFHACSTIRKISFSFLSLVYLHLKYITWTLFQTYRYNNNKNEKNLFHCYSRQYGNETINPFEKRKQFRSQFICSVFFGGCSCNCSDDGIKTSILHFDVNPPEEFNIFCHHI